jgi:NCAIR mutase (PurE)-related protein
MNNRLELNNYDEVITHLKQNAIVTLEVDNMIFNMKAVRKGIKPCIAIQNYGEYDYNSILRVMLNRNNLRVFIYKEPPYQEKCPISDILIKYWLGGQV